MFLYAGYSDKGSFRDVNEDCMMINEKIKCAFEDTTAEWFHAVICDGVGGEAFGEVAARLAAEKMALLQKPYRWDGIQKQLEAANKEILSKQKANPQYAGMATTIAGVAFEEDVCTVYHIGDSRVYAYHGNLEQITSDHSGVHFMLSMNPKMHQSSITEAQRHIILYCLGREEDHHHASVCQESFKTNDMLVISSDGLHDVLTLDDIQRILTNSECLYEKCRALCDLAIEKGSQDNISVIVCKVV